MLVRGWCALASEPDTQNDHTRVKRCEECDRLIFHLCVVRRRALFRVATHIVRHSALGCRPWFEVWCPAVVAFAMWSSGFPRCSTVLRTRSTTNSIHSEEFQRHVARRLPRNGDSHEACRQLPISKAMKRGRPELRGPTVLRQTRPMARRKQLFVVSSELKQKNYEISTTLVGASTSERKMKSLEERRGATKKEKPFKPVCPNHQEM